MMANTRRRYQTFLVLAAVIFIYGWTFTGLDVETVNLSKRWPQATAIFERMITHTEWEFAWKCPDGRCESELGVALRETLQMAIIGTSLAAVFAIPFGFLAARNMFASARYPRLGKFILNAIRAFPEVLLAILLVKAVGLGPAAGAMTMAIHSIGMLGKLYAEVVESIDKGVQEAMYASGANPAQAIWFGVVPQVLPEFLSYSIYRFEINMRSATVLGIVGGGGIGAPLIFAVIQRDWGRVGMILLGIIALVAVIDTLSSWLRSKIV